MKRWSLLLLALALLLTACGPAAEDGGQEEGTPVYYLAIGDGARGGDAIRAANVRLELPEEAGPEERAAAVVEQLMREPADLDLTSPIPANVRLLGLTVQAGQAQVDLSGSFRQLDGVDLTLADYCLTLSLTALEGINSVVITADGRPVGQQPKQVLYERDILLQTMDDMFKTVEVTLYFRNSEGTMTGEKRTLELYEGQTLAENLLAALLEGPEDRELTAVIPEGFQISYVRVDSGVCYVNLPAASLALLPEDEESQKQILWSLADSLYSIESVEELRLLADGEELTRFGEVPVDTVRTRPKG